MKKIITIASLVLALVLGLFTSNTARAEQPVVAVASLLGNQDRLDALQADLDASRARAGELELQIMALRGQLREAASKHAEREKALLERAQVAEGDLFLAESAMRMEPARLHIAIMAKEAELKGAFDTEKRQALADQRAELEKGFVTRLDAERLAGDKRVEAAQAEATETVDVLRETIRLRVGMIGRLAETNTDLQGRINSQEQWGMGLLILTFCAVVCALYYRWARQNEARLLCNRLRMKADRVVDLTARLEVAQAFASECWQAEQDAEERCKAIACEALDVVEALHTSWIDGIHESNALRGIIIELREELQVAWKEAAKAIFFAYEMAGHMQKNGVALPKGDSAARIFVWLTTVRAQMRHPLNGAARVHINPPRDTPAPLPQLARVSRAESEALMMAFRHDTESLAESDFPTPLQQSVAQQPPMEAEMAS